MGMSTHIRGFIPDNDPEYLKHKKILLVCSESGVSLPKETMKYFGTKYEDADKRLLEEKLEVELKEGVHYKEWGEESSQGYEVDLTKLPKGITKLRFFNNW